MDNWRQLSIIAVMPVSFVISILVMRAGDRAAADFAPVAVLDGGAVPPVPGLSAAVVQPAIASTAAPVTPVQAPKPASIAMTNPAAGRQSPTLFACRSIAGGRRISCRLQNNADEPASISLESTNPRDGRQQHVQFELEAGETRSFVAGASFDVRSGDEIRLQSSLHEDRIERVP